MLSSTVSFLILCLLDLSISDRGMLKSPTIVVVLSFSSGTCISVCFPQFDTLFLGMYMRIVSARRIDPFIINAPVNS